MTSLVVGSIALDSVDTPFGRADDALGGTAVYFSAAASLLTEVLLVGVVGDDFPDEGTSMLRSRGVDLDGLQRRHGRTFRWAGHYDFDMNVAHTLDTQLNVFETFHPSIPDHYRDAQFVFLGNIDPVLQLEVLRQVRSPRLTALDTMNYWIERHRENLTRVLEQVDALLINEGEIREYTGEYNVLAAARKIQQIGPSIVVVKRGEYGCVLFCRDDVFLVPAFPTFEVRDTTGAGDSFAGGFIGYLDRVGDTGLKELRAAVVHGTVMASFTVEEFSVNGLLKATPAALAERHRRLAHLTRIEEPITAVPRRLVTEGA